MTFHSGFGRALLASACLAIVLPAAAQPTGQPMRVILPVGAGSGVDALVRAISPAVSKTLNQTLVIENLPGAGGIPGTAQLAKAPTDGRTIGVVSNNHVVNPSVYKNVPYDPVEDVTPIIIIGALPFVLLAHPSLPAKDVKELVALAKRAHHRRAGLSELQPRRLARGRRFRQAARRGNCAHQRGLQGGTGHAGSPRDDDRAGLHHQREYT